MEKSNRNRYNDAEFTAVAKNDSQEQPPYLKVIADCWEHIFDYLSFEDILRMGQTCKRLNQMAGYSVREYYPQLRFELDKNKICFQDVCLKTDFYPFIGKLYIRDYGGLKFLSYVESFDALRTIIFHGINLPAIRIVGMQNVLKNVETILIDYCIITDTVFEQLANYCLKLKRLQVYDCKIDSALFSQYYPKLECLEFQKSTIAFEMDKLKIFLEEHTNLKQFEIDCTSLWANRDVLIRTNIQLNLLKLRYNSRRSIVPFEKFIDLLKILHERGLYKALQFYFEFIDFERVTNAISSLPVLERLSLLKVPDWNCDYLNNLKQLNIVFMMSLNVNAETLAKELPKLEQLTLGYICASNVILPFVRHSKRLKTIKIGYSDATLDLYELNQERMKLENACQVSIYIPDGNYLPIKWKSHNFNLELKLIRIMRSDGLTNETRIE